MTAAADYKMPDSKTIVCLGDSITAGYWDEEGLGWVSRLSQKIARAYPLQYGVLNAGISGDTTQSCWHNLISQVTHTAPDYLIIKMGVNDINICEGAAPESHALSFVNRMNLWIDIFDYVKSRGWATLVIGPLPIANEVIRFPAHNDNIEGHKSFRYEQKDIEAYNNQLEKLCKKHGVPFLRLYEDWLSKIEIDLYIDGLHPNARGHEILSQQVYDHIQKMGWLN